MRWFAAFVIGLTVITPGALAQEHGIVSPEELEQAKAIERNTYRNEACGLSITKQDEWQLYTENVKGPVSFAEETEDLKNRGPVVVVTRFPLEEEWVLVNPTIEVQLFDVLEPYPEEQAREYAMAFMNSFLRDAQAKRQTPARVSLPPAEVAINGRRWIKSGLTAQVPGDNGPAVDMYFETYIAVVKKQLFYLTFSTRVVDVPFYRHDVDRMIPSIVIAEPTPTTSRPGTKKVEL